MASPVIQFKRGAFANLPGLQAGEPALTTDTYELYVGIDSTTTNNKFFGSHRYWTREGSSTGSGVNLVEGTSNGSSYITLKSPDSLSGITTFTLPSADGTNGQFLKTNGSGTLSFADVSTNLSIAGDTGTDTVVVGTDTFTFAGTANEIETAVTDNQVQIGLPDNVIVGGALTVSGNATLGDSGSDLITVVGVTTFNTSNVYIDNQLFVGGLQITGSETVLSDDIITRNFKATGVSTFVGAVTFEGGTINLGDSSTDDINVAGEFISSLIPDVSNTYDLGTNIQRWRDGYYSGNVDINGSLNVQGNVTIGGTSVTLLGQDVYIENKDIVLGFTTSVSPNDDTANHSGVAIASTEGTPLVSFSASGINTLPDTYKQMMWFKSGTLGFSTDAFAFNYGVAIGTTQMANNILLAVGSGVAIDDTTVTASTFYGSLIGTATSTTNIPNLTGAIVSDNTTTSLGSFSSSDLATALTDETGTGTVVFSTSPTLVTPVLGDASASSIVVSGITTTGTLVLNGTSGIAITAISSSTTLAENSNSYLPTQAAVKSYVDALDLTTGIAGDSGTGSVSTSQTLTVAGTANEIETSASGQTITVGLPNSVTVTTALTTPTVNATNLKANDGTTSITITNTTGAVATNSDLTVGGNLYVNGSTTQVNTSSMTVEDRTIELGMVDGSAPSSSTTWDLGVLFNYHDGSAKKSALIWEQGDARFKLASAVSDSGGTGNTNPQITFSSYAALEIGSLWINDCAGQSQVINCSGTTRTLENITIDAGSF